MKRFDARRASPSLGTVVLVTALAACGGGGGGSPVGADSATADDGSTVIIDAGGVPSADCRPGLIAGFEPGFVDSPTRVSRTSDDQIGGDAASPGDGGSDGAVGVGIGGSLGQFRNVDVAATFADGTVLPSVRVGPPRGLATLVPCALQPPVLLTFEGRAGSGATYYDEARKRTVSFEGASLRSVVLDYTRNVGATPFTEAIVRRANAIAGHDRGWRDADTVRRAHAELAGEVNRSLRSSLEVEDFLRLPVAVGAAGERAFDLGPNGVYGLLNAGLSRAAGAADPESPNPGVVVAEQFAADMTDGRIDGLAGDAVLPATGAGRTYDGEQLGQDLLAGVSRMSVENGFVQTPQASRQYVQGVGLFGCIESSSREVVRHASALLASDGRVFSRPCFGDPGGNDYSRLDPLPPTRRLVTGYLGADVYYALGDGGELFAWGFNGDGRLGLAQGGTVQEPARLTLPPVSELRVAYDGRITIARTAQGVVYVWGTADDAIGIRTQPTRVAGLSAVVDVAADSGVLAVLDAAGVVHVWGRNTFGAFGDGTAASNRTARSSPTPVPGLGAVIDIAAQEGTLFAVRRDGTVWVWGSNEGNRAGLGAGQPARLLEPARVDGIGQRVVQVETDPRGAFALTEGGEVFRWTEEIDPDSVPDGTDPDDVIDLFPPIILDLGSGPAGKAVVPKTTPARLGVPRIVTMTISDQSVMGLTKDGALWDLQANESFDVQVQRLGGAVPPL